MSIYFNSSAQQLRRSERDAMQKSKLKRPVIYLACLLSIAGWKPAHSERASHLTSFTEYNEMDQETRFQTVRGALAQIYDYYSSQAPDPVKQACMIDLFMNEERSSMGYLNGYDYLSIANTVSQDAGSTDSVYIENVLLNIIDNDCERGSRQTTD
ncbi:MAG: hypothetical protein AAFR73_08125 [Pseudomonadota bacterium]